MGCFIVNNNNRRKEKTTAQNALQCLCCLHANILHIRSPYTGSCQLPRQINRRKPSRPVNQEVQVTMVTFHIPPPKIR